jgi:hypothetical protein
MAAASMMRAMQDLLLTLPARAIGVFYAVAGVLLLRRLPMDVAMDQMLAALGDTTAPVERQRTRVWMLGGALVFASGLSLALLSAWAPALFVAASLLQLGYLVWVTAALPPEAEEERRGRQSVIQAAVIYLLATGFVMWLDRRAVWRAWLEPPALELIVLLAVAAAVAGVLLRHAGWTAPALPFETPLNPPGPRVLRLQPAHGVSPLRDHLSEAPVAPADLGLDSALVARIGQWDAQFQRGAFPDLAGEQAWFEEGLAIAGAIQEERMGSLVNDLSGFDLMMEEVRRGLDIAEPTPLAAAAELAPRCGVAEIRDILARLEGLSWEKAELPAWDGDAQDDVARTQLFYAEILAQVRDRYGPEVRRGLDTTQAETRRWVELALAKRGDG